MKVITDVMSVLVWILAKMAWLLIGLADIFPLLVDAAFGILAILWLGIQFMYSRSLGNSLLMTLLLLVVAFIIKEVLIFIGSVVLQLAALGLNVAVFLLSLIFGIIAYLGGYEWKEEEENNKKEDTTDGWEDAGQERHDRKYGASSAEELFGFTGKTFTEKELKKRYYALMKQHHPDSGGSKEMAECINQAYEELKRQAI